MAGTPTVRTNHVPRDVIDAWQLTLEERAEFDYLPWQAIDAGEESAEFFRYRGQLYDLHEFTADIGILKGSGLPAHLSNWDGYQADTFFSATLVRYVENFERVIVGRVYY